MGKHPRIIFMDNSDYDLVRDFYEEFLDPSDPDGAAEWDIDHYMPLDHEEHFEYPESLSEALEFFANSCKESKA